MEICRSLGFQRVQGREAGLSDRVEGGVSSATTRGGETSVTIGRGERLCPRENDDQEEGLYKSKELTGEMVWS